MQTLNEQFEEYIQSVYGEKVPVQQLLELRQAFFAGCLCFRNSVMALPDNQEAEDSGMDALCNEIEDTCKAIIAKQFDLQKKERESKRAAFLRGGFFGGGI